MTDKGWNIVFCILRVVGMIVFSIAMIVISREYAIFRLRQEKTKPDWIS